MAALVDVRQPRLTWRCSGTRTAAALGVTIERRSGGAGPLSFSSGPGIKDT